MNQTDAAVWAAGLGIAGTLGGALGGAFLQGRIARRQVRDQEAAAVRYRLREERRAAYLSLLDRCDEFAQALEPVLAASVQPDWRGDGADRTLWDPVDAALRVLRRAATDIAVTGPDRMESLASEIHVHAVDRADSLRSGLEIEELSKAHMRSSVRMDEVRQVFVREARALLDAPGR